MIEERERVVEKIEVEVERPPYYKVGSIEVMDYVEDHGFSYAIGAAHKYLARYRYKGEPIRDLKKSIWYIIREIRALERAQERDNPNRASEP